MFRHKAGRFLDLVQGETSGEAGLAGNKKMKHRNSHLLVGYWSRLRKGRDVPDQTDIDPRAIKRILSHVFILESSDTRRPLYRLAGTSHCDRYGAEMKGASFLARWEAQSRSALGFFRQHLVGARSRRQRCTHSDLRATVNCCFIMLVVACHQND